MNINKAISTVDAIRPNSFNAEVKKGWVLNVEKHIKIDAYDTHEHIEEDVFTDFDSQSIDTDELYVPSPYDDVYIHYLCAMIDYYNAEYTRYNNDAEMYNDLLQEYYAWYNRQHMPLQPDLFLKYLPKKVLNDGDPLS